MTDKPAKVSLVEALRKIPEHARYTWTDPDGSWHSTPIGRCAHEAADALADARPWIPVSVSLPGRDGWYEVCSDDFRLPYVYVLELRDAEGLAYWRVVGDFRGRVTAWRELAQPYREPEEPTP